MVKVTEVPNWSRSSQDILIPQQPIYVAAPYRNLTELVGNGRRNVLVVVAHQDDEVIGMGGTIKLLSSGVVYPDDVSLNDTAEKSDRPRSLQWLPRTTMKKLQDQFLTRGVSLNLLPEDPSNVVVAYLTSGFKTEETVVKDIEEAYPRAGINWKAKKAALTKFTNYLNAQRYPEALYGLSCVGAQAAIFLDRSSKQIQPGSEGNQQAVEDLRSIIQLLRPERIYTHSPFDDVHDTHLVISDITTRAVRAEKTRQSNLTLEGFPVWNPDSSYHRILVDVSEVMEDKIDAINYHSLKGSQGIMARLYEKVLSVNEIYAVRFTYGINCFNAKMQRPRLPALVSAVEIFVDMGLLLNQPEMSLGSFVELHNQQKRDRYRKLLGD